jgi:hypothetical protein
LQTHQFKPRLGDFVRVHLPLLGLYCSGYRSDRRSDFERVVMAISAVTMNYLAHC